MAAGAENPQGFFESLPLSLADDELLAAAGSRWDDWRRIDPNWFRSAEAEQHRQKIKAVLIEEFGDERLIFIKDPRICRFVAFMLSILAELNIDAVALLPIRNPLEVAYSLKRRDGFAFSKSILLWLRHVLDAEFHSRHLRRYFLRYDEFLLDWRFHVDRAAQTIGVRWPEGSDRSADKIDQFLTRELHHERSSCDALIDHAAITPLVRETYDILSEIAAVGENRETLARLDEVRSRFEEGCRLFGDAVADGSFAAGSGQGAGSEIVSREHGHVSVRLPHVRHDAGRQRDAKNSAAAPGPVAAIGGIGGSGTRIAASLLQILGYYIGDDVSHTLDNFWFTLLFKRRSIVLEGEAAFRELVSLFWDRMSGVADFSDKQRARVLALAHDDRSQHEQEWLIQRAETFLNGFSSKVAGQPWGWKEPNTHIVIDRIFELQPQLRYVHVVRHPLDMAFSVNQYQLENWGPIILNRELPIQPRYSLAYWCAAHRRTQSFLRRWPERTTTFDFDVACADPQTECARMASFLGLELSDGVRSMFSDFVASGRPAGHRFSAADLKQFDPQDLSYVEELGYCLSN